MKLNLWTVALVAVLVLVFVPKSKPKEDASQSQTTEPIRLVDPTTADPLSHQSDPPLPVLNHKEVNEEKPDRDSNRLSPTTEDRKNTVAKKAPKKYVNVAGYGRFEVPDVVGPKGERPIIVSIDGKPVAGTPVTEKQCQIDPRTGQLRCRRP